MQAVAEVDAVQATRPSVIQVTLRDVMMWVVAIGILSALVRGADPRAWFTTADELDRALGLTAIGLALFLATVLVRQVRHMRFDRARRTTWFSAMWRLTAAALALLFAAEQSRLLSDPEFHQWTDRTPLRVMPIVGTLAMAGLVLGLRPARRVRRGVRLSWLSVLVAAAGGVAFAAISPGIIAYLVLIAMEAVGNALHHPDAVWMARPTLHARVIQAGLETLPALGCCLALALWISADLRRQTTRARHLIGLFILTSGTAIASSWAYLSAIPMLSPWLKEGVEASLKNGVVPMIVAGFAVFAAGVIAKASRPMEEPIGASPNRGIWRGRALFGLKWLAVLVLLDLTASGFARIIRVFLSNSRAPGRSWMHIWDWGEAAHWYLYGLFPKSLSDIWLTGQAPEWTFVAMVQVWIAVCAGVLLVTCRRPLDGADAASFDAVLTDPAALGPFLARSVALTVLMVSALPVLALTGLAALQLALHPLR